MEQEGKSYVAASIVFVLLGLMVLVGGCGLVVSTYKTGPTEIALVRNAGPFDDRSIDTITPPGSAFQVPGFFQEVRKYISNKEQRFYTLSSDPARADAGAEDFIQVPTADGVQVRLDATTYFHTGFTGEDDDALLQQFDITFGNREYGVPGSGDHKHVWDGNDGWNAWLDSIFRPVLENTIREEIGQFNCAELISSCALIQQTQQGGGGPDFQALANAGAENQRNFEKVQVAIQEKLQKLLDATLGEPYLQDIQFRLVKVTLPEGVQAAIDSAQSAFAQVSQQKANAQAATFEAKRLGRLAREYQRSPALAMLDAAKALADNPGATIVLGGSDFGLNIGKQAQP